MKQEQRVGRHKHKLYLSSLWASVGESSAASTTISPSSRQDRTAHQQLNQTRLDPNANGRIGVSPATKKACRDNVTATASGCKKKPRNYYSEHIHVSRTADDSFFADSDLLDDDDDDEVVSIEVPVSTMSAVEVARLVRDSEGWVTVKAARGTASTGKPKESRLARRLRRRGVGSSSPDDRKHVTATAQKEYRATAGIRFQRAAAVGGNRAGESRIVVANIEEDSVFAGTDLRLGDEVTSIQVRVDGRPANEIADLVRDITDVVDDSTLRREISGHSNEGAPSGAVSSDCRLFGRKKASLVSPVK